MSDDRRLALLYAVAVTVAVGALAGVVAEMTVFVPMDPSSSTVEARIGETLVSVLGLAMGLTALAALTVVPLYGTLSGRVRDADVPRVVGFCLAVVVCVAVGFVGVQPFVGGFADAVTERVGGLGPAEADFEASVEWVDDERAVVTFTYADGAPLAAEHVHVRAENFTSVRGVDHQEPGPWNGSVSGGRHRLGGRAIVTGDEVTVAVPADCAVGLVYEFEGTKSIVAAYSCRTD